MAATTTLRLRRVRFKDGRTLEVLRPKHENVAAQLRLTVENGISTDPENIVGYAVVIWRKDGYVFPAYHNGERSMIQGGQVPQFMKDVLLAEVAAHWARDD